MSVVSGQNTSCPNTVRPRTNHVTKNNATCPRWCSPHTCCPYICRERAITLPACLVTQPCPCCLAFLGRFLFLERVSSSRLQKRSCPSAWPTHVPKLSLVWVSSCFCRWNVLKATGLPYLLLPHSSLLWIIWF